MLTPAFHFRIPEDFIRVIDEHSQHFAAVLKGHEGGKPVEITSPVSMSTLDIICETAMGVKIHAHDNSGSDYVRAAYDVGASLIERMVKPWHWFDIFYTVSAEGRRYSKNLDTLHSFTRKVIEKRKAEMLAERETNTETSNNKEDTGLKKRRPFLDLLLETHLEDSQLLPLEGIREEVDTFVFEGHDTTPMGVSWTLCLLAENPDIQAKVHQGLDDIFGNDNDGSITQDDLSKMKYIERCIKEAQRLYPSVPLIARFVNQDLMIFTNVTYRDRDVFPDPEIYNPDRCLSKNVAARNPFAYIPFSAGPRNCIGQKFALVEPKIMVA
ncbi:cytochrome P450 4c3-like [Varroa jacobsoni]|uniref:cytochrome P450 4c3-like n=1 Tax=Varroa jacobsoni TaxID=62625 RepID=UPI000BF4F490|nr:cytochrome P450 4c3-like [Varroa jacobsoni]